MSRVLVIRSHDSLSSFTFANVLFSWKKSWNSIIKKEKLKADFKDYYELRNSHFLYIPHIPSTKPTTNRNIVYSCQWDNS